MTLTDLLTQLVKLVTFVFILSSMLGMGMSLTLPQILQPLKNVRLVVLALLANFLLAPLLAYGIIAVVGRVIPLEESLRTALIVMSTAAGAPFLPKLVQWARGNLAFGVGLMVLLMVVTIGFMPIVLPLLLPGASVRPWDIGGSLFVLLLIPLAIGLLIRWRLPAVAARWRGVMSTISSACILILLFLNFVLNYRSIVRLIATGQIVALLLFIFACLAAGYAVGGRDPRDRSVTGLGTAQRDLSAALVVTLQNFPGTGAYSLVLVTAVLLLLILVPISKWMSRGAEAGPALANARTV